MPCVVVPLDEHGNRTEKLSPAKERGRGKKGGPLDSEQPSVPKGVAYQFKVKCQIITSYKSCQECSNCKWEKRFM